MFGRLAPGAKVDAASPGLVERISASEAALLLSMACPLICVVARNGSVLAGWSAGAETTTSGKISCVRPASGDSAAAVVNPAATDL